MSHMQINNTVAEGLERFPCDMASTGLGAIHSRLR